MQERVNRILKNELLIYKCNTGAELEKLIKQSISPYNSKRPHLSLDMKTLNFIRHKKPVKKISTGFNLFNNRQLILGRHNLDT
ncbi:MAG: integrase core domain-containing protein [Flavobacteriales bacterium]